MRTTECKNVRRQIEEMPGDFPSGFMAHHMEDCEECRTVSEQQQKLQGLLSTLGTVEAPGDFDFRLRARLAGEKAGGRSFPLSNLSFGFRTASVALLLLVFGALAFISLRPAPVNSLAGNNVAPTTSDNKKISNAGVISAIANNPVALVDQTSPVTSVGRGNAITRRRANFRSSLTARNSSRVGIRDMASMPATLIHTSDFNVRNVDFPIEASTQPMKVSLDNGRGSSRTISLPPVSFGSQRALAQGAAPLMASARGSW